LADFTAEKFYLYLTERTEGSMKAKWKTEEGAEKLRKRFSPFFSAVTRFNSVRASVSELLQKKGSRKEEEEGSRTGWT
jgi:hypothetical protein